jgi:hypothetical protein
MTDLAAHRRDRTVALAAALVLLMQAFLTAWTTGAMASGGMHVDAWGNPLCVSGAAHGSTGDDGDTLVPDCCVLGCTAATPAIPHASQAEKTLRPHRDATGLTMVATHRPAGAGHDHDPGSPRAPPPAA